jgi:hypothetical protein
MCEKIQNLIRSEDDKELYIFYIKIPKKEKNLQTFVIFVSPIQIRWIIDGNMPSRILCNDNSVVFKRK